MSSMLDIIITKTRALTKVPILSRVDAALCDGLVKLQTIQSQSAVETAETVQSEKTFFFNLKSNEVIAKSLPQRLDTNSTVCFSPSLKQKAVFRKKSGEVKGKDTWLLEVWSDAHLTHMFDLSGYKKHGDVITSGDFSAFHWSPDEQHLLYVAERKRPTAASFFDTHAPDDAVRGDESRWYEDWGEQMTGQHLPVVVTLHLASAAMSVLDEGDELSLGQPCWRHHQGKLSVVVVAWNNAPRRLGLIYCTNRRSRVLELPLDGSTARTIGGQEAVACRSPRISPDGSTIVWLESAAGGPHHKGARLMRWCGESAGPQVVLDVVDVPEESGDKYAGLYMQQLPARCWVSDREVVLSTPCGTGVLSYVVDVSTGRRRRMFASSSHVTVLHGCPAVIVGVESSMLTPPRLVLAQPAAPDQHVCVSELPATDPVGSVTPLTFRRDDPNARVQTFSGVLVLPAAAEPAPLILFPHGGPHSVFTDAWSSHISLFTQLGFATLAINYRGSAGAGEAALHSLPGHIGDMDVADCAHAARDVLERFAARLDRTRVAAYGGSHGGFLVTQLAGQHAQLVRAVVARNPVCDVAGMLDGTDIADWNCVEAGFPYSPEPTGERLTAMLAASPMAHVAGVSAATLLLLGTDDRRVPDYQARAYHQALRARGVRSQVRQYDDCHPLAKPAVNGDVMAHAALWFCQTLGHRPAGSV